MLLTATSAGPGFFDTAHTSVWSLDPATLETTHLSDLFFRRPDRPGAYGDHATHLLRDGDRWLVATSTWGDFERRPGATVRATLAETSADLLTGAHLLDTRPLDLPTTGLRSVGVWDPHLVRTDGGWLAGYVSASRFFRFHPALATGPSLDALTLRAAASDRTATEGTTLAHLDGGWRVLASDGRDGRRGQRERYPVFDLDLRETGTVDAPYPSNIPWPTLVPDGDSWLLVELQRAVVRRAAAGLRHARRPGVPAPFRRLYRVTQDTAPPLPCPRQRHTTSVADTRKQDHPCPTSSRWALSTSRSCSPRTPPPASRP